MRLYNAPIESYWMLLWGSCLGHSFTALVHEAMARNTKYMCFSTLLGTMLGAAMWNALKRKSLKPAWNAAASPCLRLMEQRRMKSNAYCNWMCIETAGSRTYCDITHTRTAKQESAQQTHKRPTTLRVHNFLTTDTPETWRMQLSWITLVVLLVLKSSKK